MALIPYIIFAVLVLVAALVGFIFIQLKAHPYWRVTSLALVLLFSCWICFGLGGIYYTQDDANKMADYDRGTHDFVAELDALATQGRTNDVHQLSQRFSDEIFLGGKSTKERMDKLVEDAYAKTR